MKICAIICEYNPFHNGHQYHIKEALKINSKSKVVINKINPIIIKIIVSNINKFSLVY